MQKNRSTLAGILSALLFAAFMNGCAPVPQPSGRRPLPSDEVQQAPSTAQETFQESAEWAYQQGLQYLDRAEYDQAIHAFHLALERNPQHLRSYLSLGDVYSLKEEFLVAETYYNKVLQYDPQSIPAIAALATMHWRRGNYRDALTLYHKVLEIDPQNQYAQQQIEVVNQEMFDRHYQQGLMFQQAGDLEQAAIEFQKAYSVEPENWSFAVEIAYLFLEQRDYTMADGYFQQVLTARPDFVPALIGAGRVQLGLKQYQKAVHYFERAAQLNPGNPEIGELLRQTRREQIQASLPQEYWDIPLSPQVTRGEIAALLIVDLVLEHRITPPERVVIISDITTHWAKAYIIKAVQYGIMSLPPDRFFRPNEPISRGEFAFVLDTLFQKIGQPLPPGSQIAFSDVHPDNAYHDAIARVSAAGLMTSPDSSMFGLLNSLSGAKAMQIFENVKARLR